MPEMLTPDRFRFGLRDDMPELRLDVALDEVIQAEEWMLLNRLTLCLVDGPDQLGFVLARFGAPMPDGWDDAVELAEGATVYFGADPQGYFIQSQD